MGVEVRLEDAMTMVGCTLVAEQHGLGRQSTTTGGRGRKQGRGGWNQCGNSLVTTGHCPSKSQPEI